MESGDKNVPTLRSCLKASRIRNIDGIVMGKDGNPLKPMQKVQISDKEADTLNTQNPKSSTVVDNVVDSTKSTMGLKPSVNATVQQVAILLEAMEFNTDLKKEEVKKAPVWVKLHHVPIVAYFEIRLSHITTQIGTPIMLDTYISNMCVSSWGRSTYARALVEISAEVDLVDELVIAIPVGKDMGHSLATVTIEYEWRPPRCSTCMIFYHTSEKCTKRSKELQTEPIVNDGFEVVKKKKNRSKNKQHKQVDGVKLCKPALNLHYRRVEKVETLKISVPSLSSKDTNVENLSKTLNKEIILTSNSFTALMEEEEDIWGDKATSSIVNDSDSEEVDDELIMEGPNNHSDDNLCSYVFQYWDWTPNGAWCSKGDFNAALTLDDMVTGASNIDISMREFKECVDNIEVMDVHNTGLKYTWTQKPKGSDGVLKKIDRVMANIEFFNVFPGGHAIFQQYRLSDHSLAVLCLPSAVQTKPKPFKFTNILVLNPKFKDVVMEVWNKDISGFHMYNLVRKLKSLQKPLRKLLIDKGNLHENMKRLRHELDTVQRDLDRDRLNVILRVEEALYVQAFNEAILLEEKHKAKVNWLRDGDSNSAYFHKSMKNYISRNRIDVITNSDGVAFENEKDSEAFVSHYEVFLGQPGSVSTLCTTNLFVNRLDMGAALDMTRDMASVSSSDEGAHSKTVKVGTEELLRSSFASKIRNVDGKILGKDGRPMRKAIRFQEPVKVGEIVSNNQVTNPSNSFNCGSFASVVQHNALRKVVKVLELHNKEIVHGAAVAIPLEAVKEVSARFENTLYGYFVGKKLAFPLVENYVKNTWIKFGLDRVMNKNGFFYFQFSTRDGMEKVIENGPWLIRSVLLILNVWTPNAQVKKDDIKLVPVWVKLRHVPVVADSEIGLSLITTQLRRPIMLDSYTCNMCINPWGKSDYARALIQVSADVELTKLVVVAIPFLDNTGHSLETVDVEYEEKVLSWFQRSRFGGFKATKSKNFVYQPVKPKDNGSKPSTSEVQSVGKVYNLQKEDNGVKLKILFEKLNEITMVVDPGDDNLNVIHTPIDDDGSESAWRRVAVLFLDVVNMMVLSQTNQVMHVKIMHKKSNKYMFCSIIYAGNLVSERRLLWDQLVLHKQVVRGQPWTLLGDFNVALNLEDYHLGPSSLNSAMVDFKDCVAKIEVMDVNSSGLHFTWNQKPRGGGGVLKKLDRIMGNVEFFDAYPSAHAIFHPYRISDHSPSVLNILELPITKPRPFKFFNFVAHKPKFLEVVADHWSSNLRVELDEIQKALDKSPSNSDLRDEEAVYVNAFNEAKLDEERFLKQKAKIDWLDVGDSNSAYFHKAIKSHNQWNRIESIINADNIVCSGPGVQAAFVQHYESFLGTDMPCDALQLLVMIHHRGRMDIRPCFSRGLRILLDMMFATRLLIFFNNGLILREIYHTFLALIPKVSTPSRINDFRPISCCNVIYKCISKILTNRIIEGIKEVVSDNQSAFVPGRRITDNILITQELMHGYHLDKGTPRCAFKIDIQKSYDTVDWKFLEVILWQFGFPNLMIQRIMACVTTTSFSISINRDIHGFFNEKRGFRQGDPLSPYLFTLVMEVLTLILHRRVAAADSFSFHKYCNSLGLVNVCFANDLFIFARGDVNSAKVIMESLDEFKNVSGLVLSLSKSTAFFCNVPSHVKQAILQIMPFSKGTLPVIYLGVPLISSRLFNRDCKFLVEKAKNRIGDWKNKSLSYAGRLQLCKSVIASMHVYWASVLIIPKGKAKVAWHDICIPKKKGGLGIRSLEMFNIALMTTHIWNLVSNKDSIWVRWINIYKLKGRSFWDVPVTSRLSWGWRKLLQLRNIIRLFFWSQIGSGHEVYLWFDRWCVQCPLRRFLSARDISREGFSMLASVKDMISNEGWLWPQSWLLKALILGQLVVPSLDPNKPDLHYWHDSNGVIRHFSVKAVWEEIRPRGPKVPWFRIVWFSHNVPRHAFHLWLVMRRYSHEHLFYECSFSSKVWCSIRHLAAMDNVSPHLQDIVSFLQPIATKRTAISIIGNLLFASSSYFLWIERNNRLFKGLKRSLEDVRDIILVTELNHTIIALVLKVASPSCVNNFRPISCCNVLFKCISKIIANRIKESLKTLVSPNQSAFVPGRSISDNILLTQELMHNYHLDRGPPRCAFKVDIQKAYDTGKTGLRQGDPLSPDLFTLMMEILMLMIRRRVHDAEAFTYRYCSKLDLVNLYFADDLFLFVHGDTNSARVIMDALDEFKQGSGLTPSSLPVKYLGVPLVLSRQIYHYCKELIEKKGQAKVAWDVICFPRIEGGLGIRRRKTSKSIIAKLVVAATS
nr:hypothetical protein [Tanacetum cinerariifolium]